MLNQRRWQRIILLIVLAYEGLGCLAGGAFLVAGPDGRYMKIPVGVLHGAFRDFLIPGVILLGLGILNVAGFVAVLRRSRRDWLWAGLSMGGLAIWFLVEIIIVRELVWLHAMWGFPVILGGAMALPLLPFRAETRRDTWLVCGVASSLLYLGMNIIVPMEWTAYDPVSQTISELSTVGAPTRPLWVVLVILYALLVAAFGWGVRMAAGGDRRLRVAGTLIAVYGALGIPFAFAPMHSREVLAAGGGSLSDTLHLVLGGVTEVLYLVALGFAAAALGTAFRLYSIATFISVFLFGAVMFQQGLHVGRNEPTPLLGVWERINIGLFMLWVIVLAIVLLVRGHAKDRHEPMHALAQPA